MSISSGKGGVGKTLTTVNLAVAARRMGLSVLILDGDFGLANVDVVLGLQARYNINDVLEGTARLSDIVLNGPLGIKIIPSGSGLTKMAQLSYVQRLRILDQIDTLEESYNLILVDTGAGLSDSVLHLNSLADELIVVTTPEPHAMTDAYALIKVMVEERARKSPWLLVNMVGSQGEGEKVYQRISEVAGQFIGADVRLAGIVRQDPQVQNSVMLRNAASESSTHTLAGQAWNNVARNLLEKYCDAKRVTRSGSFWQNFAATPEGTVRANV